MDFQHFAASSTVTSSIIGLSIKVSFQWDKTVWNFPGPTDSSKSTEGERHTQHVSLSIYPYTLTNHTKYTNNDNMVEQKGPLSMGLFVTWFHTQVMIVSGNEQFTVNADWPYILEHWTLILKHKMKKSMCHVVSRENWTAFLPRTMPRLHQWEKGTSKQNANTQICFYICSLLSI